MDRYDFINRWGGLYWLINYNRDIAACYADPTKALNELGWSTQKSLEDMMQDTWRWQQLNPDGYDR